MTSIRAYLRNRRERHAARDRYFKYAREVGQFLWDLDYSNRTERIRNLSALVFSTGAMARESRIFDNDRTDDMGFTPEQWHQNEASLFLLVLAAEEHDFSEIDGDPVAHSLWLDPRISDLLDDLSVLDDRDMEAKARILLRLCDETAQYVGGQATEGLAALAHVYYTSAGMTSSEAHTLVWGKQAA